MTKKLTLCIQNMIEYAVSSGKNFQEVLTHIGSIVPLMDFLDESSLIQVSRIILADVAKKPFDLNDQLSIRILLELSQLLYQSLSVLSPVDVVEKTNQTIEWFLYRADFGKNVSAHLNFLISARTSFPTSNRLLGCISRIALKLANLVFEKKVGNFDDQIRSILAFALTTIGSVSDLFDRASLLISEAKVSLICTSVSFAQSCFDEFLQLIPLINPSLNFLRLLQNSLSFLLILPAKPRVDPFEVYRSLIKLAKEIKWADDEFLNFSLDCLSIVSHSLRTEYVLKIDGVDSNNILFGSSEEYLERGFNFLDEIVKGLLEDLNKFKSKGVMATKTKIPAVSLKAMVILVDSFQFDQKLAQTLSKFGDLMSTTTSLNELKKSTFFHLKRIIGDQETGAKILAKYFKGY